MDTEQNAVSLNLFDLHYRIGKTFLFIQNFYLIGFLFFNIIPFKTSFDFPLKTVKMPTLLSELERSSTIRTVEQN